MPPAMFQRFGAIQSDAQPSERDFEQVQSVQRLPHAHLAILAIHCAGGRVQAAEGLQRAQRAARRSDGFLENFDRADGRALRIVDGA